LESASHAFPAPPFSGKLDRAPFNRSLINNGNQFGVCPALTENVRFPPIPGLIDDRSRSTRFDRDEFHISSAYRPDAGICWLNL